MDIILVLLLALTAWHMLRANYQRTHIALLGRHLANLQLERYLETLAQGYTRAIKEPDENRQIQVLDTFTQTEHAAAAQLKQLADAVQKEDTPATRIGILAFCVPYIERFLPVLTRDFRQLLHVHAAGMRHVVDNTENWDTKTRAFHISAELYLFQHSCHWFCKSRTVADARLMMRHQVNHEKVLASVSDVTRAAYTRWLQGH